MKRYLEIEGRKFMTVHAAWLYAVANHGFTGTESTFRSRVETGHKTWERLSAPVSEVHSVNNSRAKQKARDEMRAICEMIDSRKALLTV